MNKIYIMAILTLLTACTGTGMVVYEEPTVIATSAYPPGRLLYLPLALGYYREEGVNVDFVEIADENLVESLTSGHADLVQLTTDWFVLPASQGIGAKELFYTDLPRETEALIVRSDVEDIAELAGKKIAVLEGTIGHYFLSQALDMNGMQVSDVYVVSMPPDKAALALIRGDVDGAVIWDPWMTSVLEKPEYKALYYDKDVELISLVAVYARDQFIQENPGKIRQVMKAFFRGIEYWKKNPHQANQIMAEDLGVSRQEFEHMIGTTIPLDLEDNLKVADSTYSERVMSKSSQLWQSLGYTDNEVNPEDLIDTSLLEGLT